MVEKAFSVTKPPNLVEKVKSPKALYYFYFDLVCFAGSKVDENEEIENSLSCVFSH